MKLERAPIEVFSLSFLDIISCAFGAVVMLILLAKNGDEAEYRDVSQISSLIMAINQAESSNEDLASALSDKKDKLKQLQAQSASNQDQAEALESDLARAKNNVKKLTDAQAGLVKETVDQDKASTREGSAKERDDEVGGIPVDSDYVIFIIDTSGSMKGIWAKVLQTMDEVLNNHPEVKGFQVMSDNGQYLLTSTRGKWRKDSPRQRQAVLRAMQTWYGASNSSPMEGIEEALKTYASKTNSLALYIFGDDYTGGSYDKAIAKVNRLNRNRKTGKKVARIHAVGFKALGGVNMKFATLMREVTRQNNGTLISAI
jgi:hypothetical protein